MSTMNQDSSYADVVHTVVALARTMQMKVTVEGVESEDQLMQLQALGCDYVQGYYFSEPLEAPAAGKLLATEHRWLRKSA